MAVDKSDRLVTVAGASGFLGRYVVQELCRLGFRVRAVCRRPQRALFLTPLGSLAQVQLPCADPPQPAGPAAPPAGTDAVLNLVWRLNGDFTAVQFDSTWTLAHRARVARGGACG